MMASDVTDTLKDALQATGLSKAKVRHKPRLLSDNGPCYISSELRDWLQQQNRESLGHFFALVIRRGIAQGHFRPELDVEYAAAVWFALVAPQPLHFLTDRRSVDEIAALTTDFFLAAVSVRSGSDRPES